MGAEEQLEGPAREYAIQLGDHLRRVRVQKRLSLADVEAASAKEFKTSILGAYERGERAITVARLARLAELYRVPLGALLPGGQAAAAAPDDVVTLSVSRLRASDAPESRTLLGFVRAMQAARADWSGDAVRIRGSDVLALASALDRPPDQLLRRIEELGLRGGRGGDG